MIFDYVIDIFGSQVNCRFGVYVFNPAHKFVEVTHSGYSSRF